jgi:glutamate formiminotransferase/formiminotetrahydrofolate cyclodeaminase
MVVSYSIGRKDLGEHQDELKVALTELARAQQVMLELMVEDQAAYEALTAARKLPEDDPARRGKFDAALLACIRIPQSVGATASAILQLCDRLVERVNKNLLSDLAVCAELAIATVRCAAYNVKVNLADVADPNERSQIELGSLKEISDGGPLVRSVIGRIWARQGFS